MKTLQSKLGYAVRTAVAGFLAGASLLYNGLEARAETGELDWEAVYNNQANNFENMARNSTGAERAKNYGLAANSRLLAGNAAMNRRDEEKKWRKQQEEKQAETEAQEMALRRKIAENQRREQERQRVQEQKFQQTQQERAQRNKTSKFFACNRWEDGYGGGKIDGCADYPKEFPGVGKESMKMDEPLSFVGIICNQKDSLLKVKVYTNECYSKPAFEIPNRLLDRDVKISNDVINNKYIKHHQLRTIEAGYFLDGNPTAIGWVKVEIKQPEGSADSSRPTQKKKYTFMEEPKFDRSYENEVPSFLE